MATIHWKSVNDTISRQVAINRAPPPMGLNSTLNHVLGRKNPTRQYRKENCISNSGKCNVEIIHLIPRNESCCTKDRDKITKTGMVLSRHSEKYNKYSNSMAELLRKRCVTYEQRLSGTPHSTEYHYETGVPNDEYSRTIGSCSTGCKTTYKPNNKKFSTRGAVDSSTRLTRLKQDTIRTNFKSLSATYGINTANTLHSIPSYTLKSKTNVCNNGLYRRNGSKLMCR